MINTKQGKGKLKLLLKIEEITIAQAQENTQKSKYFDGHGCLSQTEESECM
jgi:hypothetical protein